MYSAILLNGGVGKRFGAGSPKQFTRIRGVPILVYSLVAIDRVAEIDQIVVNHPVGWREPLEQVLRDYPVSTPVTLVESGATRHESVARMLPACSNDDVIVHETARPLVPADEFQRLIAAEGRNVTYALEIPFTVAPIDPESGRVTGSLERDRLRNVQLPQKFSLADLRASHEYAKERGEIFTEDATLCTVAGHEVTFIPGSDRNIKITRPLDVHLANFLLTDEGETDE